MWALIGRGEAYRLLARYGDAWEDFTQALELDPDCLFAVDRRGKALLDLGRYQEALADFDRAADLSPGEAWPFGWRGEAYRGMRLVNSQAKIAGGAKKLARLIKAWKYYNRVPISSFYLEMRAAQYLAGEPS